jgi:pyruvate/2-oxoglutarate/acetoin dehydrogenase E1 component
MAELKYEKELSRAMEFLSQDPRVVFIGQAVAVKGTAMTNTLKNVDSDKKVELPVAEEMQMGMALGMALVGYIPVAVYPRYGIFYYWP